MTSRPTRLALACLMLVLAISNARAGQTDRDASDAEAEPAKLEAKPIDFARQIQPLLARKCYACHGPDQGEGGLRLNDRDSALAETDSGDFAIVPGDLQASVLIARVTSEVEGERMPPEGDRLTDAEVDLLRQWIAQDAPWSNHWAFEPMKKVTPPTVDDPIWNANPVDAFIYHNLATAGLRPNPPADRRTLIRRAHYDLTGLPPTSQEVEQFVADPSPDAFAKLVDRLLESNHYGEKWGRHWLDLVRYAETNSYERDGAKPNAWKYRDYVIKSFNDDKPYAQFVREQLAGDEVDLVTTETLTATGYYRLAIWDDEPADPLQAKFDELDDIISTTGQVFMGLTVDCARCHDHKIDPIPQTDYYSMLAFLADVTPYGHRGDQHSNNQLDVSSAELNQRYSDNDAKRREVENAMREIEQEGIVKMSAPDQRATEGDKQARDRVLNEKLQANLTPDRWEAYVQLKQRFEEIANEFRALPPRERVLALATCEPNPQPTFVLFRGNPHSPTDEVGLAFPTLFGDAAPSLAPVASGARSAGRRRVLADWIVNPDNRLSWRVIANRVWQFHFGRGIVESTNNFGQLGTPPTHPELLDYLAAEVIASEGRLKSIHRLIMNSRTYQMSSETRQDASSIDPGNDLFWKFDIRRLSAEEVRDSILAVNGSLNREVYGPSIYPRLSAEVLAGQSQPGSGWGKSSSDQENRRSVYIHVKRSLLTPLLSAFDLPEPDRSCEARFTTLQPGQALALLNGDFIHEQATRLADSVGADDLADDQELVRRVVQAALGRQSTDEEAAEATRLLAELQTDHGLTRRGAIDLFCLTVMNWNEFVFLD